MSFPSTLNIIRVIELPEKQSGGQEVQSESVSKHKKLRPVSENYLAQSNFSLKELNE